MMTWSRTLWLSTLTDDSMSTAKESPCSHDMSGHRAF